MVPLVDAAVVDVTVMHVLLFVLLVCMLREYKGAIVTEMQVWVIEEMWVWWLQDMWVVHVVLVLCLAELTCYGWEELEECVRCVSSGRRGWRGGVVGE